MHSNRDWHTHSQHHHAEQISQADFFDGADNMHMLARSCVSCIAQRLLQQQSQQQ
jgi:hypothetical protein